MAAAVLRPNGIGRVQVDLAGAARGQHRVLRFERQYFAGLLVLHVQAVAARLAHQVWRVAVHGFARQLVGRDDVDGAMVLEQRDVRVRAHLLFQGDLHGVAGGAGLGYCGGWSASLAEKFRSHGVEPEILLAKSGEEMIARARQAVAERVTVVVAGGGDGTR